MINPYDLLGVTFTSTCQEVKRRYYALACLCHPDRGGTTEQMQAVHHAFEYVMRQVALNKEIKYEQLEADFEEFCTAQTAKPPTFYDIHNNTFELDKFHACFDQSGVIDRAFLRGGYATVPSEATTDYSPVESRDIPPFSSDMVVYTEPSPLVMPQAMVRDFTQNEITDFSCWIGPLQVSDYKAAFLPPQTFDEAEYEKFNPPETEVPDAYFEVNKNDTFHLEEFNKLFEKTDAVDRVFPKGGYPTVPTEVTTDYSPVETHDIAPFPSDTTTHSEPVPLVMPQEMVRDFTQKETTDFSCSVGPVMASDYKVAFSPPPTVDSVDAQHDVEKAFLQLVESRA